MLYTVLALSTLFLAAAEEDGHAHGDGGEPCGCAQYEADHPFKIDCSDKATINAAIDRLKKLTPSKAECEKVVDGVMTNQVDFFIMQAHHDYCDHDTLRTGDEKIFHDWESHCLNCVIKRGHDDKLDDCPHVTCSDHSILDAAHFTLVNNCEAAAGGDGHAHRRLWAQERRARRLASHEGGHGHGAAGGDPWEWEGIFPTAGADSLTFRLQKVGEEGAKAYPDDYMTIMVAPIDADEAAEGRAGIVHMHTDAGANPDENWPADGSNGTPNAGGACTGLVSCTGTNDAACTVTPGTTCYTLTLDQANAESYYKIATTGIAHIVMFAEHLPVEFEDTAHYLVNTVGMGTDAEVDVEPSAQKPDPAGKCCESQADMFGSTADSVKATIGAFKSVVAYHDLCGHDELPPMVEHDFHDYEANCAAHFCNAVEKGVDQLACPSPPPPSTDVEVGAVIGIAVGAGVALILLGACICFMYVREKSGKPVFTNLDVKQAPGV